MRWIKYIDWQEHYVELNIIRICEYVTFHISATTCWKPLVRGTAKQGVWYFMMFEQLYTDWPIM